MSAPLLELINVSKYFGYGLIGLTKFPAVDNISLAIKCDKPEIITIVGESGSGKSTLAKLMLRILRPTLGTVKYRGNDVWRLGRKEVKDFIKNVQPIFQDPMDTFNIFETVDGYLLSIAQSLRGLNKKDALDQISRTLEFVGLNFDLVKGKRPNEFSGGQIQRISIARALLAQPKLLIADEPVSMLDASLRVNILNLLRRVIEELKTSIVYITHDLATARYIGHKIIIMYRGSVVESGDIDDVVEEPLHPYTKLLLESLPDYRKRGMWLGTKETPTSNRIMEVYEMLQQGCKYIYYCPFKMERCRIKPDLFTLQKERKIACWLYHGSQGLTSDNNHQ